MRYAARVEYNGRNFSGWQSQFNQRIQTVQETLEAALGRVAGAPIRTCCAGRTDRGVHGFAQFIHFDDHIGRSPKAWLLGTNRYLPSTVRVHWVEEVPSTFHARFSALTRKYRYIIYTSRNRSPILEGLTTWFPHPLDVGIMNDVSQVLVGEHDFSAFRAAACQSKSPVRRIFKVRALRQGDLLIVDITANAFVYHMARNIVGSLLSVGSGRKTPDWFESIFEKGDRTLAAPTAAADGLYLANVGYPDEFLLPESPDGPRLIG